MNGFHEKGGILYADNLPLPELAKKHGTPLYVYSAERMRENVHRLHTALGAALPAIRQPLIAFACKANSNLAVLKLFQGLGLGCDVVSGGELTRALTAGIKPEKIVYSGVGKSDDELRMAIKTAILQINVESREELERIAALSAEAGKVTRVAFRLNPDVAADTHHKISTGRSEDKFGMPRAEIEALYQSATDHPHLQPYGLQVHIGSQLMNIGPFRQAYEKLADLAKYLQSRGLSVKNLDLGGGLGIIYKDEQSPDLTAYAAAIRDIIMPLNTQITLEPGRFLVGDAGLLLTQVSYIKQGAARRYIVLDAGMNDLMRPALYDAFHAVRPVQALETEGAEMMTYDIVGPVCETGDTFLKDFTLPQTHKGDLLALMSAGAYGFVMASNYNTRPFPAEILVDGNRSAVIRQRQSVQDILEQEQIPEWLTENA